MGMMTYRYEKKIDSCFIEKVVVHEATGGRKGKDRKQQVDVYFNFIGNCQVPQKADIEKMA